jgi:flagellar basal-body rod protein FlgB
MLEKIAFFANASQRIEWLTERQRVIAGNVANANTPGYKAQDVAPFESLMIRTPTGTLNLTHERHLAGTQRGAVESRPDPTAWEESLDGNTVVIEQQTIRANETFEQFNLASQAYKKGKELLTLALVGNR